MQPYYTITQLTQEFGVTTRTLRFYYRKLRVSVMASLVRKLVACSS